MTDLTIHAKPGNKFQPKRFLRSWFKGNSAKSNATNGMGSDSERSFLPDFCHLHMVVAVMIIAELLAITLALFSTNHGVSRWDQLGVNSLFIQWVALASAAVLCVCRNWLNKMSDVAAGLSSYLCVLLVTAVIGEAAYWSMQYWHFDKALVQHWEFMLRILAISAIVSAVSLRILYLQHQQRIHAEAHANARIQALQARIRPHFLFNSINTIAALIRTQPENAEEALEDMADLFRASLGDAREHISLSTELENTKRYLHMEQLRLGDRLQVEWDLGEVPLSVSLPALSLQPLLENAIYHGIEPLETGGKITVVGHIGNGVITLTITNPTPRNNNAQKRTGHNIALNNIRERLQIAFGAKGGLYAMSSQDQFTVEVKIPAQEAA